MPRSCRTLGSRILLLPAIVAPLLLAPAPLLAKEGQGQAARIDIIRGLQSEIAVAKMTLPRGKHGVYLDSKGELDRAQAEEELKANGAAVGAGAPVQITKVSFKSNEVLFEINHGGKGGKHWYQHIEVGMGTSTAPVGPMADSNILSYGSYISLKIPGEISQLTVPIVKKLLASVLDFERHSPTVLYASTTPPKFKEAIKKHEIVVGMDRDAVLSAKGPPDRKVREAHEDGSEEEDWIYGIAPHVLYVIFDGDAVKSVKQY